jgi:hypothetical protein
MLRHVNHSVATRIGLALATVTLTFCAVGTVQAQTTYVGASAVADIARFGSAGVEDSSGGEAFGWAIRVGTAITDRWGIDLEFTRPGEIEQENSFSYLAGGLETVLPDFAPGRFPPATGIPIDIGRIGTALSVPFSSMTKQRYSTLTVMPYVRQSLGSRADILYSGGLALVRNSSQVSLGGGIRLLGSITPFEQSFVTYGAAPVVGVDVRVSMTDHLRLVPGLRLLVVDEGGRSGWVTRPSIGLQWTF